MAAGAYRSDFDHKSPLELQHRRTKGRHPGGVLPVFRTGIKPEMQCGLQARDERPIAVQEERDAFAIPNRGFYNIDFPVRRNSPGFFPRG
jgi:hypothetical protein